MLEDWKKGISAPILDLWSLSGSAPNRMLAVGFGGTVLAYNGSAWTPVDLDTGVFLTDVWAEQADRAFIVGDGGTIIRYAP